MTNKIKMLLIDDQKFMLTMLKLNLQKLLYTDFVEVTSAAEASKAMEEHDFDLIFCDWNMPDKNGLEFFADIQKNEKTAPAFILLTAESDIGKFKEAKEAGIQHYLTKPFKDSEISASIKKVLSA